MEITFLRIENSFTALKIDIIIISNKLLRMLPYIFIGLALVFVVVYFLSRKKGPSSSPQPKPPVSE